MDILGDKVMNLLLGLQRNCLIPVFESSVGNVPFVASNSCRSSCSGSCDDSCMGGCEGSCAGSCDDSCTGSCEHSIG